MAGAQEEVVLSLGQSIRSETLADLIELNTRWLAQAAKAFNVPIVLQRTVSSSEKPDECHQVKGTK